MEVSIFIFIVQLSIIDACVRVCHDIFPHTVEYMAITCVFAIELYLFCFHLLFTKGYHLLHQLQSTSVAFPNAKCNRTLDFMLSPWLVFRRARQKAQELFTFVQSSYVDKRAGLPPDFRRQEMHGDDSDNFQFCRPEPPQIFRRLPEIKPRVIFYFWRNLRLIISSYS